MDLIVGVRLAQKPKNKYNLTGDKIQLNLDEKFMKEISLCKDPTVFVGVAHILGVSLLQPDGSTPKEAEILIADVVDSFSAAPRARRKELYQILHKANK